MNYRRLGRTEVQVSVVGLGCWALIGGDTWGHQDREDSRRTIEAALDAGINFFDTAENYGAGESEELLGNVLAARRDEVVIATKVSRRHLAFDEMRAACENSLRRLKTDHIDLYQVHWPNPDVPLADTLAALEALKETGKVRAVGVSNFGASYLAEAVQAGRVESNQVAYSLLFRAIEHEVQPMCAEHGISILPYSPLAQGLLTGKFRTIDDVPEERARTRLFSRDRPNARHDEPGCEPALFAALDRIRQICEELGRPMNQVALGWLLAQDAVTSVIAGARRPDQAAENARAADVQLPAHVIEDLYLATAPVKAALGTNIDPWQTNSRADRIRKLKPPMDGDGRRWMN